MALLVVLLVLVLGYYYAAHIPSEQIKLGAVLDKQSC